MSELKAAMGHSFSENDLACSCGKHWFEQWDNPTECTMTRGEKREATAQAHLEARVLELFEMKYTYLRISQELHIGRKRVSDILRRHGVVRRPGWNNPTRAGVGSARDDSSRAGVGSRDGDQRQEDPAG